MKERRESGFYWIKSYADGDWQVAEWDSSRSKWTFAGYWDSFSDEELKEIDERRIVRE